MIINDYAPYTGFGDDYTVSVKFAFLHPDNSFPQWTSSARMSEHSIRNSNKTVSQFHGRAPYEITLPLYFASIDDLEALDELVGRSATLRYLYGISKRIGGARETISGQNYLNLEHTILWSISNEQYQINGPCEASVTFRRSYSDSAVVGGYGFAVYGEDV